ncbi:MAG: DUF502 domain-containing protein [Thalassotalea sp.]|nr:DUF502 domain-containing protein [Thalassotalea sp.]
MFIFLKNTIKGGFLFLMPVIIFVMILGKAYEIMLKVAEPLGELVPIDVVGGVAVANIMADIFIVLLCFVAGLFASSRLGKKLFSILDDKLMLLIPGYAYLKSVTEGLTGASDETNALKPVMVRFDDQLQIGYEVERTTEDLVVVFFPGAPDPRSGGIAYVNAERIEPINDNFIGVLGSLKRFGKGSSKYVNMDQAKIMLEMDKQG